MTDRTVKREQSLFVAANKKYMPVFREKTGIGVGKIL